MTQEKPPPAARACRHDVSRAATALLDAHRLTGQQFPLAALQLPDLQDLDIDFARILALVVGFAGQRMADDGSLTLNSAGQRCRKTSCGMDKEWQ